MSSNNEKQDGLPEIYLSPSCHTSQGHGAHTSSDTEANTWEDTDNEAWIPLVPELSIGLTSAAASILGLREEIEGGSAFDIPPGRPSQDHEAEGISGGGRDAEACPVQPEACEDKAGVGGGRGQIPRQRGETPGSDCPPVASITAFVRRLGQPLNLDTDTQTARSTELIFSPGGDQGFIVPRGVHAYYGSGSDTETLEWEDGGGGPALVRVRDAVEGADAVPSPDQTLESGVEGLERNSPAGLSTPDAEIDLSVTARRTLVSKAPQETIRPPAVGQSEEVLMQASRKDLGSTDGEESEEESKKRVPQEAMSGASGSTETQLGSLGSQSENTDSVSTVLDMQRGEVQGCERECAANTAVTVPALGGEATLTQPKPAFVVGGLISPRGKLRQFQDAVRDRMQNVKASLDLGSGSTDEPLDRHQYLSQLPLYPQLIPTNEPEVSLASFVSVESTNPPESSDRVTSPSVLSVSSVASSKRMEWDSGADVGYLGTNTHVTPAASLSTLERIALGSYASVLRTEPEGTTQGKEKQKVSKKGVKSGSTKASNQGAAGRASAAEAAMPFPLYSARMHQNREKVCWSSSEEDLHNKLPSPAQSPRRRLRRRGQAAASPRDGDASARRSNRAMHFIDRRLRDITQERHNEGKSSSLVELTAPAMSSSPYRRSNSQQSLHMIPTQAKSSGAAERETTGAAAEVMPSKKGEQLLANTSTSTSTLVQSMSPLPAVATSTSTAMPGVFHPLPGRKEGHVLAAVGDSRCSSMSSLGTHDREYPRHLQGKPSWTSSGNDISSRSEASSPACSPAWLPSHHDTESLTSRPFTAEPSDLKARKNSENAKNHNRRGSSTDLDGRAGKADSSSSSQGQLTDPWSVGLDMESTLESQVSLQSFNNALHALSVKLQEHIQALLDNGSLQKVQDYNKLQDYVRFVGIPSVTEEECRLRQGVAGVITRMFGEIEFDQPLGTTDTSNTFTSETSDSHGGDQHQHTSGTCDDLDVPLPWCDSAGEKDEQEQQQQEEEEEEKEEDGREKEQQEESRRKPEEQQISTLEQEQQGDGEEQERVVVVEQDRCITPNGTVMVVPYRPPSATRTYFMAVSHEWEAGLVEGEQVAASSEVSVSRGQAEGERLEGTGAVPRTPRLHHTPSDTDSNNEWDAAKFVSVEGVTEQDRDEEALPSLPSDHQYPGRSQGSDTPQSESSLGHSGSPPLHTWARGELSSGQWWVKGGGRERLYKDRRGGLHVAHQPPGYTDDHDDSHPSESLSDQDHRLCRHSGDTGRPPARPWTSSGSESAYETIRERHRNVDEALASSFEFYSTSPRDARLLGYVSSEGQEEQQQQQQQEVIESPMVSVSPDGHDSSAHTNTPRQPWHPQQHQQQHQQQQEQQEQQQQQEMDSQISFPSSHTDAQDVSSQISFIQQQKQKYVRKIQRHISTLEKLERALLDQLGDSIGSEGTFRQRVSESHRSHAGSDTSANARTRDILDHSDTTTSSIKSSEESTGAAKKHRSHTQSHGIVGVRNSHPSGQASPPQSNNGDGEAARLSFVPSVTGQSYSSSPRINISQISSDMNSSRASTMRQVEEEVRKLAIAEEQSRKVVLRPHSSSHSRASHFQHKRRQNRKESGREDSAKSALMSQKTQESTASDRIQLTVHKFSASKRVPTRSSSSELPSTQALPISEESGSDVLASENLLLRQGDGKESKDKNQTAKPGLVTASGSKTLTFSPPPTAPAAREVSVYDVPSAQPSAVLSRDFGQMFPSSECITAGSRGKAESVGVQTSNSLLYPRKSSRKQDDNTAESTSDKESMAGSLRNKKTLNRGRQVTGINEDDNTKKHMEKTGHKGSSHQGKPTVNRKYRQEETQKLEVVSKRKEKVSERSKSKESKSTSHKLASKNNKKVSDRPSNREGLKHRRLPQKELKIMSKSESKRSARVESRTTTLREKCNDPQERELSSRSASESEDKTISSTSSISHSIQSTSHMSSEHSRVISSKVESIASDRKQTQESDRYSSSTEYSKELDHHSQVDMVSSDYDDITSQGHPSLSARQCATGDEQPIVEDCSDGLKGGAEDCLVIKAPTQLLISPPKHDGALRNKSRSVGSGYARHKSTELIIPSQTKIKNLKNKLNLLEHGLAEEKQQQPHTIHDSDSQRQEKLNKLESLKTAWVEDKDKERTSQKKPPVRFDVKFAKERNSYHSKSKFPATTTTAITTNAVMEEEPIYSSKVMTLQEALARARPDYLREAGDRSALIRLKREMRQAAQSHNHNVLAQIPSNLQTPSTLQRFMYKPDLGPLFTYKDIRQQNQRLYSLLPESQAPGVKQHRAAVLRTNRLLSGLYSQRLRKKVMQGQVSHAHKEVVTPLARRVLQQ